MSKWASLRDDDRLFIFYLANKHNRSWSCHLRLLCCLSSLLLPKKALFAELDEVLSDGRPFLFGDHMTSADITLASLGYLSVYYENKGASYQRSVDPTDLVKYSRIPLIWKTCEKILQSIFFFSTSSPARYPPPPPPFSHSA